MQHKVQYPCNKGGKKAQLETRIMRSVKILALAALLVPCVHGYAQADRDAANKFVADAGFPVLNAFNKMTPKHLVTVLKTYTAAMEDGAFEFFDKGQIEVIYATVSAINNCEMCLSFHAMALGGDTKNDPSDIAEIAAGGLPKDPEMRKLAVAAKYAMAHKGIFLEREKKHLATMGFEGEKLVELNFLCGFMSAHNQVCLFAQPGLSLCTCARCCELAYTHNTPRTTST